MICGQAGKPRALPCKECNGIGYYYVCPTGMNPFYAGAIAAAAAAQKVICECIQPYRRKDGGVVQ